MFKTALNLSEPWVVTKGLRLFSWDMLLISGLALLVTGMWLALNIPQKMEDALSRLVNRGVLQASCQVRVTAIEDRSPAPDNSLVSYGWHDRRNCDIDSVCRCLQAAFSLGKNSLNYYGGLWRLHCRPVSRPYGFLWNAGFTPQKVQKGGDCLAREAWLFSDAAAGLKPIGDFYFFQVMRSQGFRRCFWRSGWALILSWRIDGLNERWKEPYLEAAADCIGL